MRPNVFVLTLPSVRNAPIVDWTGILLPFSKSMELHVDGRDDFYKSLAIMSKDRREITAISLCICLVIAPSQVSEILGPFRYVYVPSLPDTLKGIFFLMIVKRNNRIS